MAERQPDTKVVHDRLTAEPGFAMLLLAAIVESSDDAIASKTLDGIVTSWNRGAERLFGYSADEIIGRHISMIAAPGREGDMAMIIDRIRRGERVEHFDTVRRRKDGTLVEVSVTVSPVRDEQGRIIGASKIARDITERRQIEREREMRLGELRHRVKNLLALVQALARRSGTEGCTGDEYREAFMGRLEALAVAHELAFGSDAGIALLVQRTLEPYKDDPSAVTVEPGPDVTLPAAKVQALALVLHELATNAVKYGALSTSGGGVRVAWEIVQGDAGKVLHLHWKEQGGPPVQAPDKKGFGINLVEYASARELGAPAELTFAPEGLEATVTVQLG